ncbi:MAG: hypothetical protein AVDCRST_MAG07-244 [uncultured Frankineae bacterium]|uniref:Uncharacterized protein n=1 Tax=uncultured Frankineae bacterium TaxID=437475 RepID=A0A6J4KJU1_9ACTN|nr:MAG: hypothetical protein AVDCRST_MAG07-244 [uncultured Frankineae bacterium]
MTASATRHLDRRLAQHSEQQRLVLGAGTYRLFAQPLGHVADADPDPIDHRMRHLPTTVLSTTLTAPLAWPDATVDRRRGRGRRSSEGAVGRAPALPRQPGAARGGTRRPCPGEVAGTCETPGPLLRAVSARGLRRLDLSFWTLPRESAPARIRAPLVS